MFYLHILKKIKNKKLGFFFSTSRVLETIKDNKLFYLLAQLLIGRNCQEHVQVFALKSKEKL